MFIKDEHPDLLTLIAAYLPLEKSRVNYKAPCPFHDDPGSSFMVSPEKNIYKCFGCGVEGNAANFIAAVASISLRPISN